MSIAIEDLPERVQDRCSLDSGDTLSIESIDARALIDDWQSWVDDVRVWERSAGSLTDLVRRATGHLAYEHDLQRESLDGVRDAVCAALDADVGQDPDTAGQHQEKFTGRGVGALCSAIAWTWLDWSF